MVYIKNNGPFNDYHTCTFDEPLTSDKLISNLGNTLLKEYVLGSQVKHH